MRASLALVLLCGGCLDLGVLSKTYCQAAGATLCDGFETGAIEPGLWTSSVNGVGETRVVEANVDGGIVDGPGFNPVFHNTHSLEVTADAGAAAMLADVGQTATLKDLKNDGGDSGDIFVRFRVYFSHGAIDTSGSTLIRLGDDTNSATFSIEGGHATFRDTANGLAVASSEFGAATWFCVELDYIRDNGPHEDGSAPVPNIAMFVNEDPESPEAPIMKLKTAEVPTSSSLHLGLDRTGLTSGVDGLAIYYDDVIVDHQHIGCVK